MSEKNSLNGTIKGIIIGSVLAIVSGAVTSSINHYFSNRSQESLFKEERIRIAEQRAYEEKRKLYFDFIQELNSAKPMYNLGPEFMVKAQQLSLIGNGSVVNAVNKLIVELLAPEAEPGSDEYFYRTGQLQTALVMAMRYDLGVEPDVTYNDYLRLFNLEGVAGLRQKDKAAPPPPE